MDGCALFGAPIDMEAAGVTLLLGVSAFADPRKEGLLDAGELTLAPLRGLLYLPWVRA
jgi:hypothetical protein